MFKGFVVTLAPLIAITLPLSEAPFTVLTIPPIPFAFVILSAVFWREGSCVFLFVGYAGFRHRRNQTAFIPATRP